MNKTLLGLAIAALLFTGCKQADDAASATPAAPGAGAGHATASGEAPAATGFDIEKVLMSTATLGDFPYITLPAG